MAMKQAVLVSLGLMPRVKRSSHVLSPDLNTFINDYVCAANNNGSEYFYFSFKDALWTEEEFGGKHLRLL